MGFCSGRQAARHQLLGANRYRNPDEDLPQDFDDRRKTYYEMLQQPLDVGTFVARLRQEMVDALTMFDQSLPKNPWVELLPERKNRIKLSPLTAQPEPPNLLHLKYTLAEQGPIGHQGVGGRLEVGRSRFPNATHINGKDG